jgi:hypothetical protein
MTSTPVKPADDLPERTLDEVMGCIPYEGPPRSLEEMEEAIARGARPPHRPSPTVTSPSGPTAASAGSYIASAWTGGRR